MVGAEAANGNLDKALDQNTHMCPELLHNVVSKSQERARLRLQFCYDLALEVMQHHLHPILSVGNIAKLHQEHRLDLQTKEGQLPKSVSCWHLLWL